MRVLYVLYNIYISLAKVADIYTYRSLRSQTYGACTESAPSNFLLPGRCWGGFNRSLESRHSTFPPEGYSAPMFLY